MTVAKRKISVSLDADLVQELEQGDAALSKQVNEAVRAAIATRRRRQLLQQLLDDLEQCEGPLSPDLIAKYEVILA